MSSHNLTMNNSRTGTDFHSSATTHSVPSLVHSIGPAPSVPPSTHSPQDAVTVDQLESSDMHNTACIESGNAGEGMVAMRPSSSLRLREFVEERLDELERFSFPLELDPKEDATGRLAYLKKCKEFDFFMFPISSVVCHFHLETINLDHAGLGDKGAIALAEALYVNQCVATLIVSNNFITPKGGEHLLFAVRENRTIRHLDVSHNRLGYRAAHLGILPVGTLVRHILLHNERIVELLLADNKIGDKDMAEIAEGLIENFTLQRIDLRENELSPKGGEHAALVLKRNSELKSMNLSWNALRSNGSLLFLRDGLAETNVLKVIHLSWNGLNDDGGIVLGQVIRDNASLEDIDVSHNRIGINGAQSLAEGMKVNTTLKRLWLNNNPLRDVGCAEILRTIPDNGSIVFLDVRFTDSGFETVQSMQSINEMQEGKRNKVEILFGDIPAH